MDWSKLSKKELEYRWNNRDTFFPLSALMLERHDKVERAVCEAIFGKKFWIKYLKEKSMELKELQQKIGEWSWINFGLNEASVNGNQTNLSYLCPLMGITEEMGEFAEASEVETPSPEQIQLIEANEQDALADTGVYLMDFINRAGLDIAVIDQIVPQNPLRKHPYQLFLKYIGQLNHHVLKRHQNGGIRGYESKEFYEQSLIKTLGELVYTLKTYTRIRYKKEFWEMVEETFNKIVSKRDWKENKFDGVSEIPNPVSYEEHAKHVSDR